jgi:hypothetical protein
MITGIHIMLYSENSEADRAFFRDVLQFRTVNAGRGWLIFALPPAEAGIHPAKHTQEQLGRSPGAELSLMCDDLEAQIKELETQKVICDPIVRAAWGTKTTLRLPGGGTLGLYQPRHPTALNV